MEKDELYQYLLLLGDNSMILGQRLGELCGHGPELETDIALTNISLDLFGQVRNYFQYAAEIKGEGYTEDKIAMLRHENEYRNALLVEQPNKDFAHVICRQYFFDVYHKLLLSELSNSMDEQIAAIARKSIKEVSYHVDFSTAWMKRLGDGTEESHNRMQEAVDFLWPYAMALFQESSTEEIAKKAKIGADLPSMQTSYKNTVVELIDDATLILPQTDVYQFGGKNGVHTEEMGFILSEFQFMQRAYPNMKW